MWGLIAVLIAGIIIWYWHRKDEAFFLFRLTRLIRQQIQSQPHSAPQPSSKSDKSLTKISKRYATLFDEFNDFFISLNHSNNRDKLTGLPNRLSVKSYLSQLPPSTLGTLVLIDIYRFRFVNDLFGFTVGDTLLKLVSLRLQGLPNDIAYIARMNEDEFLLHFETPQTDRQLLEIRERLQAFYEIEGSSISVQLQMGVVDFTKFNSDVSTLLRRLDLSLTKAKAAKPLFAHYAKGDDSIQKRQLRIINHLPKALKQNELYMVYQPKLAVALGNYHQVEALMRWEHSELGTISPAEFIPLAEHAGMIELVSQWALEQVISQQATWQSLGIELQVAVNLSTQDMISDTLCDDIQHRLRRYDVPGRLVSIEITESQLMNDMDIAVTTINKLKSIGVDVAIDDFGTGHSSLAYLKLFPVDEIKIDKAFLDGLLTDERASHIMRSCITMAKGLHFSVTVEGVESEAVSKMLIDMGVDKIQGDYFSKPLTASEIESASL